MVTVATRLLTVNEVAVVLRVSPATVYRMLGRADIAAIRIGGQIRITEPEVERFLKRQPDRDNPTAA